MIFVNRTEEQIRIKKIINSSKSGFIVVYGRRRCGKSTLLKRVLNESDIYFMADQSESPQQIALLAQSIATRIPGFDQVRYPDWESLFNMLNNRLINHE